MSRLNQNRNFLELLTHSNKKLQKSLIENASKDQIYSICEIVLNILNGNLNLDKKEIEKLARKKKQLRLLVNKGSIKNKKHLIQKGGFIQFLIPAIITGLASIVSSIIEKS